MGLDAVEPDPKALRVLVVEDDHDICELICEILAAGGAQTVCARSDREAYAALSSGTPFMGLLVDVNLGSGTTGYDVARHARQLLRDVPVVYVSGQSSAESFEAFGVPGSKFIAKPFTGDELVGELMHVFPQLAR